VHLRSVCRRRDGQRPRCRLVLGHLGGARSERGSRNTLSLPTGKSREWEVGLNATLLPAKTRAALCHRRAFGAASRAQLAARSAHLTPGRRHNAGAATGTSGSGLTCVGHEDSVSQSEPMMECENSKIEETLHASVDHTPITHTPLHTRLCHGPSRDRHHARLACHAWHQQPH
jgi:hypothetical protein